MRGLKGKEFGGLCGLNHANSASPTFAHPFLFHDYYCVRTIGLCQASFDYASGTGYEVWVLFIDESSSVHPSCNSDGGF